MTDNTTNYSDILDFSKDKVPEGDYLKLANFLKTLHQENQQTIVSEDTIEINLVLKFETYRGKKHTLKINKIHKTCFERSSSETSSSQTKLFGSLDNIPFEDEEDELFKQWKIFFDYYGVKNIKRSMMGADIEHFKTLGEFKKYLEERTEDFEQDIEIIAYSSNYLYGCLLGMFNILD